GGEGGAQAAAARTPRARPAAARAAGTGTARTCARGGGAHAAVGGGEPAGHAEGPRPAVRCAAAAAAGAQLRARRARHGRAWLRGILRGAVAQLSHARVLSARLRR